MSHRRTQRPRVTPPDETGFGTRLVCQPCYFRTEQARAILEASGAGEIVEEYGSYDHFASTHVFGTCRMGDDPEDSVVDASARSHRWRNLWVSDASIFPSSGGGEAPSLTIEALGLRAARSIATALAGGSL